MRPEREVDGEAIAFRRLAHREVREILEGLPDRDRFILEARILGIPWRGDPSPHGDPCYYLYQREVAVALGISKAWASTLERRILRRLGRRSSDAGRRLRELYQLLEL